MTQLKRGEPYTSTPADRMTPEDPVWSNTRPFAYSAAYGICARTLPGWRNEGFRGFADYMQTADFEEGLRSLIDMGRSRRTAIMCAEAVPWRRHRSLVADALVVRGIPAIEILSEGSYQLHKLTPFARVQGTPITYPPEQASLI